MPQTNNAPKISTTHDSGCLEKDVAYAPRLKETLAPVKEMVRGALHFFSKQYDAAFETN